MLPPRANIEMAGGERSLRLLTFEAALRAGGAGTT
jgi:hypothetical protein